MEDKSRQIAVVFISTLLFREVVKLSGLMGLIDSAVLKLIVSQIVLAVPAAVYLIICGVRRRESFTRVYAGEVMLKRIDIVTILLSVLMALLMRPVLSLVNYLSSFVSQPVITDTMTDIAHELPFAAALPAVAIVPAFLEESIYRGVFFKSYREINLRGAVIACALMFGLMHGNLNQFIYATISGAIFCMVIVATDSIVPVMVMHFTINAVSFALLYLQESGYLTVAKGLTDPKGSAYVPVMIVSAVVSAALFALIYRVAAKRNGRLPSVRAVFKGGPADGQKPGNEVPGQRIFNLPLVLGMLLCFAYMVINELALAGIVDVI